MVQATTPQQLDPIETTAMGIRELVIEYFKGDCVRRVTDARSHLNFRSVPGQSGRYYADRRARDNRDPQTLRLDNLPLLAVAKHPDELTLYDYVYQLHPDLAKLRKAIEHFLTQYLPHTTVRHNPSALPDGCYVPRLDNYDDYLCQIGPLQRLGIGQPEVLQDSTYYSLDDSVMDRLYREMAIDNVWRTDYNMIVDWDNVDD